MSRRLYLDRKGSRKHVGSASRIKKRKPPPNRYTMEGEEASTSESAKRLKTSEDVDIELDATFGYRIINFVAVFSAISEAVKCKTCNGDVKFTESSIRGLGFKVKMSCESCEPIHVNSSPLINGEAYDVNRRIVFAFRLLGIGLAGIDKFCGIMDMPKPIFQSFYDKLVNNVHIAAKTISELSMKKAVEKEREINLKMGNPEGIAISGDATLRKQDFSSLFGVSTIVANYTGMILDIAIKSRSCQACEFWQELQDTEEYNEWKATHDNQCSANQEISYEKIKADSIVEIFARSEEKYQVKYTNYIGDEESETYKKIIDSKPYGDIVVENKPCIRNIQKRMSEELRTLKKENVILSGKGMLTAKLIDELTAHFGLAIRNFSNSTEEMRNAIWATFYHKISTDKKPQHEKCPSGKDSWCSWQKAKANGTLKNYKHEVPLSAEVQKAIRPVYERLSSDDLLKSCLGGFKQKNIETVNAEIWSMAPEVTSSDEKIVEIAAYIASSIFNDGYNNSILLMMKIMNLTIGPNAQRVCENLDKHRVTIADLKAQEGTKDAKKLERATRREADDTSAAQGSS